MAGKEKVDWSKFTVIETPQNTQQAPLPVDWSQFTPIDGQPGMTWGEVGKSALKNAPQSAANVAKGIASAAYDLRGIVTGEGTAFLQGLNSLGDALHGGLQKAGIVNKTEIPDQSAKFDALMDALKARYGGTEAIKKTIATDPAGVVMDVLGVVQPVSGLVGKAGAGTRLGSAFSAVSDAGRFVDPVYWGAKGISAIRQPESIYASAIKPSATMKVGERDAMLRAGIKEGILPTREGLDKARDIVSSESRAVDAAVDAAAKSGGAVSANRAASAIDDVLNRNVAVPSELAPAAKVQRGFLDAYNPANAFGLDAQIPVTVANDIKRSLWKELQGDMGRIGAEFSYADEAKRALASSLRRQIEDVVPSVAAHNQRISPLIDLTTQTERAINRADNWNLLGLGAPMAGGMVGLGTGDWAWGAGVLAAMRAAENPANKARLAMAIDRAGRGISPTSRGLLSSLYLTEAAGDVASDPQRGVRK